MTRPSSDVAFTPVVKAIQARRGSREQYAKVEERGGWRTNITSDLAQFLAEARSFYLATASAEGQPYIQHRGGPPGFLRVLDERTLGFLPISRAIANTSPPATWPRTPRPTSSSWTTPSAGA